VDLLRYYFQHRLPESLNNRLSWTDSEITATLIMEFGVLGPVPPFYLVIDPADLLHHRLQWGFEVFFLDSITSREAGATSVAPC
jgi:hypothetical protein